MLKDIEEPCRVKFLFIVLRWLCLLSGNKICQLAQLHKKCVLKTGN